MDENRTHLQLRETIRQAALTWEENHQNEDLLVHKGVRLEEAKGLAQQAGFLNQLEAEYVKACVALVDANKKAVQRRQRITLASLTVGIIIAVSLAALAWVKKQEAVEKEQQAKKLEIKALSDSSDALFQSNRTFDALLNGLKAAIKFQQAGIQDSELEPKVYSGLQNALYWVRECNTLEDDEAPIASASFSPKDRTLATININGRLILWKQQGFCGFTPEKEWNTQQRQVQIGQRLRFNPEGDLIAVADYSGAQTKVKLWKRDGEAQQEFPQAGRSAVFLDGQQFASEHPKGTVGIWSIDNKTKPSCQLAENLPFPTELNVSYEGQRLALANENSTINLWKIDTINDCEKLRSSFQSLPSNGVIANSIDFSPDGQLLVSANRDGTLNLFQLSDSKLLKTLDSNRGWVNLVRFSSDKNHQRFASAGTDKTIKLWDKEGTLLETFSSSGGFGYTTLDGGSLGLK